MKKKLLAMFCVCATLFASVVVAEEPLILVNEKGEVRVVEGERLLTAEEREAYLKPGTKVPVFEKEQTWEKVNFRLQKVYKSSEVVIYDGKKLEHFKENSIVKGEPKLMPQIPFVLSSLFLMMIANVLVFLRRNNKQVASGSLLLFTHAAVIFNVFAATFFSAVFSLADGTFLGLVAVSSLCVVAIAHSALENNKKIIYRTSVLIFYVICTGLLLI